MALNAGHQFGCRSAERHHGHAHQCGRQSHFEAERDGAAHQGPIYAICFLVVVIIAQIVYTKVLVHYKYHVPDEITPLSVIGILKQIRKEAKLEKDQETELSASINRIEEHYFSDATNGESDQQLDRIAHEWVDKAT